MMASDAVREFEHRGFAHVRLSGKPDDDLPVLQDLIEGLGTPIHVFRRHPFWKELGVDSSRPPGRSGGIGFNSLHVDCVNVEFPPDILVLYCVRPDPLGGGASLVAVTDGLDEDLGSKALSILRTFSVSEGSAYDLDHVGGDANPFTIRTDEPWKWRYTGRLLESRATEYPPEVVATLLEFDRALLHRAQGIWLRAGDALVVNQRRAMHGRLPLAPGQDDLKPGRRRLLMQAFGRLSNG